MHLTMNLMFGNDSSKVSTHVGSPPEDLVLYTSKWCKHIIHFHDFENLTTIEDEAVESPKFMCAGHKWVLQIYPGGVSTSTESYMAACLMNKMENFIIVKRQ